LGGVSYQGGGGVGVCPLPQRGLFSPPFLWEYTSFRGGEIIRGPFLEELFKGLFFNKAGNYRVFASPRV